MHVFWTLLESFKTNKAMIPETIGIMPNITKNKAFDSLFLLYNPPKPINTTTTARSGKVERIPLILPLFVSSVLSS